MKLKKIKHVISLSCLLLMSTACSDGEVERGFTTKSEENYVAEVDEDDMSLDTEQDTYDDKEDLTEGE